MRQRGGERYTMGWRLGCLALLLAVSACSAPPKRDTTAQPWPELAAQAEGCSDIAGRYRAVPQVYGRAQAAPLPLLAYTLLPAAPELAGADRVTLELSETQLTVTAYAGALPLLSHRYRARSEIFECIAGSLEFHPGEKPGAAAAATVPGLDWETVRLRRTSDGSLLLQKADGLAGLSFMLFPIYLTRDNWYLFKPSE